MSSGHSHALPENKSKSTLWIALGLTTTFLMAEVWRACCSTAWHCLPMRRTCSPMLQRWAFRSRPCA